MTHASFKASVGVTHSAHYFTDLFGGGGMGLSSRPKRLFSLFFRRRPPPQARLSFRTWDPFPPRWPDRERKKVALAVDWRRSHGLAPTEKGAGAEKVDQRETEQVEITVRKKFKNPEYKPRMLPLEQRKKLHCTSKMKFKFFPTAHRPSEKALP